MCVWFVGRIAYLCDVTLCCDCGRCFGEYDVVGLHVHVFLLLGLAGGHRCMHIACVHRYFGLSLAVFAQSVQVLRLARALRRCRRVNLTARLLRPSDCYVDGTLVLAQARLFHTGSCVGAWKLFGHAFVGARTISCVREGCVSLTTLPIYVVGRGSVGCSI